MPAGRPRKSAAEHNLHGNPGKRPAVELSEPQIDGPIECPEWLPDAAKAKWRDTVDRLRKMGRLTESSIDPLTQYCVAWGEMIEATKDIAENGRSLQTEKGYRYPNPAVAMQRSAMQALSRLSAVLGLDPRSGLAIPVATEEDDQFGKFLGS